MGGRVIRVVNARKHVVTPRNTEYDQYMVAVHSLGLDNARPYLARWPLDAGARFLVPPASNIDAVVAREVLGSRFAAPQIGARGAAADVDARTAGLRTRPAARVEGTQLGSKGHDRAVSIAAEEPVELLTVGFRAPVSEPVPAAQIRHAWDVLGELERLSWGARAAVPELPAGVPRPAAAGLGAAVQEGCNPRFGWFIERLAANRTVACAGHLEALADLKLAGALDAWGAAAVLGRDSEPVDEFFRACELEAAALATRAVLRGAQDAALLRFTRLREIARDRFGTVVQADSLAGLEAEVGAARFRQMANTLELQDTASQDQRRCKHNADCGRLTAEPESAAARKAAEKWLKGGESRDGWAFCAVCKTPCVCTHTLVLGGRITYTERIARLQKFGARTSHGLSGWFYCKYCGERLYEVPDAPVVVRGRSEASTALWSAIMRLLPEVQFSVPQDLRLMASRGAALGTEYLEDEIMAWPEAGPLLTLIYAHAFVFAVLFSDETAEFGKPGKNASRGPPRKGRPEALARTVLDHLEHNNRSAMQVMGLGPERLGEMMALAVQQIRAGYAPQSATTLDVLAQEVLKGTVYAYMVSVARRCAVVPIRANTPAEARSTFERVMGVALVAGRKGTGPPALLARNRPPLYANLVAVPKKFHTRPWFATHEAVLQILNGDAGKQSAPVDIHWPQWPVSVSPAVWPRELPRASYSMVYDAQGRPHRWDVYVYDTGEQTATPGQERLTKNLGSLIDAVCSVCQVRQSESGTIDAREAQRAVERRGKLQGFLAFYQLRCPVDGVHEYPPDPVPGSSGTGPGAPGSSGTTPVCKKCSLPEVGLQENTAEALAYLTKYETEYTRDRQLPPVPPAGAPPQPPNYGPLPDPDLAAVRSVAQLAGVHPPALLALGLTEQQNYTEAVAHRPSLPNRAAARVSQLLTTESVLRAVAARSYPWGVGPRPLFGGRTQVGNQVTADQYHTSLIETMCKLWSEGSQAHRDDVVADVLATIERSRNMSKLVIVGRTAVKDLVGEDGDLLEPSDDQVT